MKTVVHKSPIPIYVTALAWVVYALLLPLYRPVHFLPAILVTAAVGVVARLLCPNRVEEVAEAPQPSGNPELDEMVQQCRKAMADLQALDDAIADETLSDQIARLGELTGKIMARVQEDPSRLPQVRKFMSYYLPTTVKLLTSYRDMSAQGVAGENISGTMAKVEAIMATIVSAFSRQLDNLFGAEAMDISADITVLENMMVREGLADDQLHRGLQAEG